MHTPMSADDPRHGTRAGAVAHYKAGERNCEPCRLAANRANKRDRHRLATAGRNLVPLGDDAHQVVATYSNRHLAEITGILPQKFPRLRRGGPGLQVNRRTRDRILNATPRWTPIGLQRRLQALSAIGYSAALIADEAGTWQSTVRNIQNRDARFVRDEVADLIVAVYTRLEDTPAFVEAGGSSARARSTAARHGWLPPAAWDDVDTDPIPPTLAAVDDDLDDVAIERRMHGDRDIHLTLAEKAELARRWTATGQSLNELQRVTGLNPYRYLQEAS